MPSHNQIILAGHLADKPELRWTQNQKPVANFRLGISMGKDNPTEWVNCVLWGASAESFANKFNKGDAVHILDGKLKTRSWEKDGIKRYATEVHCFYASGRKKQETSPHTEQASAIDDLPF